MLRRPLALLMLALAAPASAQTVVDVQFPAGNFGTMIEGTVVGDGYVDYRLGASAGQQMSVQMMPAAGDGVGAVYYNILPPGSTGEAIYNSSVEGDSTTVTLPADGTYTIRVYLLGGDADAGKTAAFAMDLSIQ